MARAARLVLVVVAAASGCGGGGSSGGGRPRDDAGAGTDGGQDAKAMDVADEALVSIPVPSPCESGCEVTTVAGSGVAAHADGAGPAAAFDQPRGVAVSATHTLFVADRANHRVRWIAGAATATPTVETYAGTGVADLVDGASRDAAFSSPSGIAVGPGDVVLVADTNNHRVRRIESDVVTTLAGSGPSGALVGDHADGDALAARFDRPEGVALTAAGAVLVADTGNHVLRVIDSGFVTTVGVAKVPGHLDGAANTARFDEPAGIAVAPDGTVYVADRGNRRVRRYRRDVGTVETVAGSGSVGTDDGRALAATFADPGGIAVDSRERVWVIDGERVRVVRSDGAGLVVETVAGSSPGHADGPASGALFADIGGVALGAGDRVFLGDTGNHRVRSLATTR